MEVAHEGGLLRFRLPAGWRETRDADGESTFFPPDGSTRAVRVKVLTFTSPEEVTPEAALAELAAMEELPGDTLEQLPNGNALRAHQEQGTAAGEPTTIFVWLLASAEPPHRMRMAVFSLTVMKAVAATRETLSLVAALDTEIRGARFARAIV